MNMRALGLGRIALIALLLSTPTRAEPVSDAKQTSAQGSTDDRGSTEGSPTHEKPEPNWRLAGAAYLYLLPESSDYVQPTLRADHFLLHLEARYAYEDRRTGSTWIGLNVAGGDRVSWEVRPMFGSVFGRTNGIAAGYEGALGWWKLELYSEGELLLDFSSAADSFFFNWSELTLAPIEWFRFGLMAQRTRLYSSGRELERGLLAGFSWKAVYLTLHVVNPDDARPIVIVALGGSVER
jgi:hypothetical protein